jgi:hypothetical protein
MVFVYSTRYSCQVLKKFKFSPEMLEKYSNAKFHENPFSGSRVVPRGQKDGRRDI